MIHLKITSDTMDEVEAELGLILAHQDVRPLRGQAGFLDWRMNGHLSQLILQNRFQGKLGEALLMPTNGRIGAGQIMILGLGNSFEFNPQKAPQWVTYLLERILQKKNRSVCLSLSDLVTGMFEWRNSVRLFLSRLSGRDDNYHITLLEPAKYVEDAKARHMEFAYDVQVQYC